MKSFVIFLLLVTSIDLIPQSSFAFFSTRLDNDIASIHQSCQWYAANPAMGWVVHQEGGGPDGCWYESQTRMGCRYRYVCELYAPTSDLWWDLQTTDATSIETGTAPVDNPTNSCPVRGSIIYRDKLTVGEEIPIVGTPLSLVYMSDQSPGYLASRKANFLFESSQAGSGATGITASVTYAGQTSNLSFPASGGSSTSFTWNGQDSLGNPVASAAGKVTFHETNSLGLTDYPVSPGSRLMVGNPNYVYPTGDSTAVGLFLENRSVLKTKALIGSWRMSLIHHYDPNTGRLELGNGITELKQVKTVAGNYEAISDDGSEVYVFNSLGRHLSTLTSLTGSAKYTFSYNTNGTIDTITDAYSNVTTFTYLVGGSIQITGPYGQTTNISTDTNGYLSQVEYPAGVYWQMTYWSGNGLLKTFTKPSGEISTFTYNSDGQLISDSSTAGTSLTLSQALSGTTRTTTATTAVGRASTITTQNDGTTEFFTRNELEPSGVAVSQNSTTTNASSVTRAGVSFSQTTQDDVRFGSSFKFISNSSEGQGSYTRNLDATQAVVLNTPSDPFSVNTLTTTESVNWNPNSWVTTYVGSTKTFTTTSPVGRVSTRTIDSNEKTIGTTDTSFSAISYSYDTHGRPYQISQGTRTSTFAYNTAGFLSSVTDPMSKVTSFTYDSTGRVLTTTLPDSRVITYTYDSGGNLASITPPSSSTHSFINNLMDFPTTYLAPSLGSGTLDTTYVYSNDRELTQVTRPSGAVIALAYDATTGLLSSIASGAASYGFTYPPSDDRIQQVTSPDNVTSYHYWSGRLSTQTQYTGSADGLVNLAYDNLLHLASFQIGSDSAYSFLYDDDELLTSVGSETINRSSTTGRVTDTGIDNAEESYTYDSTYGEIASYQAKYSTTNNFLEQYTRDDLGRISTRTVTIGTGSPDVYAYTYDSAGRLTDVTKNSVAAGHYVYDSNSNRTLSTNSAGISTATYDAQDRLSAYGTLTFGYNLNGERTSRVDSSVTPGTTNYTWDAFSNLKQVTLPSGTQIDYQYDGFNRRVTKLTASTVDERYVYLDQTRLLGVLDASGSTVMTFFYGVRNTPEYMIKSGTTYKFFVDHVGSVRQIVNTLTGTVAQELTYDEFGRVLSDSSPGFQPFGFAGGLYDSATKLVQFGQRWYDPEVGRWLSKDPILFGAGDTNLYGYTFNDPVNFIDPSGLFGVTVTGGFGAAASSKPGTCGDGSSAESSGGLVVGTENGSLVGGSTSTTGSGHNVTGIAVGVGVNLGIIFGNVSSTAGPGSARTTVVGPLSSTVSYDSSGHVVSVGLGIGGHGWGLGWYTNQTTTNNHTN